eukprot:GGOE01027233.1.p1 GENE.GGOE01027233.1~~GGOE01027233.1.p1  ORF type:complete len:591 (+),score=186.77 GGOE01027233.1:47-1774(+)
MAALDIRAKIRDLKAREAKEWDFYGLIIGPLGCKVVAEELRGDDNVFILNLDNNAVGPEGAKVIAQALATNHRIHTLYLGMNSIRDEGASALAECLQRNTTLHTISLGVNGIKDEGAKALLEAVQKNTGLRTLWLNGNPIYEKGILTSVEKALQLRRVEKEAREKTKAQQGAIAPLPNGDLLRQNQELQKAIMALKAEHQLALEVANRTHQRSLDRAQRQIQDLRTQLVACSSDRPGGGSPKLRPLGGPATLQWEEVQTMLAGAALVGQGGFGPVYRCDWAGQPVAVKTLSSTSPQGLPQFYQEIQALTLLRHPHVIELRALAQAGAQLALVYPLAELGSLDRHLPSPTFPWLSRLHCAVGILHGVQYLHSLGVLHRDIKPLNVLLFAQYRPRLADFGVCRLSPELLAGQTHVVDRVVGTKGYLAPEVASSGRYSFQSDVFSVGLILLQLFFVVDDAPDEGAPRPPSCNWSPQPLEPPIPVETVAALGQLVEPCMAQEASARGQASSVGQSLRRVLESSGGPRECVVCLDAGREVRLPCKHKVLCSTCARLLPDCPLCRMPFQSFVLDEAADTFV